MMDRKSAETAVTRLVESWRSSFQHQVELVDDRGSQGIRYLCRLSKPTPSQAIPLFSVRVDLLVKPNEHKSNSNDLQIRVGGPCLNGSPHSLAMVAIRHLSPRVLTN